MQPTPADAELLRRLAEPGASIPTPAELDVLYRLCQPQAKVSSVARDLEITEHAVKARLRSLYRRLGVNDRLQAYAKLHPPD